MIRIKKKKEKWKKKKKEKRKKEKQKRNPSESGFSRRRKIATVNFFLITCEGRLRMTDLKTRNEEKER